MLNACIPNPDGEILMVDYVIDGDTFVADGKTVRIWGVDTPEKDEPFYEAAKLTLELMIDGALLDCTFIAKGKYRRDVMRCYAGDTDIGSALVEKGLAKDANNYLDGYYQREEAFAERNKLGIWKD